MTNQNLRMQHNLQQQIQAMNDSGVPEETLRDIQIMFKHFDKDNTGFLEHAELKSCLRALGVNMSIPDDPAEPVPEFEEILNKLDPNRDGKVSLNEYTSFMIQRETSKVSGTANVIAAFKNIASTEKPYLTKSDVSKNLTKEQARFAMENMEPFEDESGNIIPDTYDYKKFVETLFN